MIHDLDLEMVIDVQGTLNQYFTEEDKNKLEEMEIQISIPLWQKLEVSFREANYLSEKLSVINLMRKLNYPNLKEYTKKLQDEL